MSSIFHLREEQKRSYILNRSPAKMAASSPPAAARISTMMSFSSAGSEGMSRNLMSSSKLGSLASAAEMVSWANSFMSGSPSISLASSMSVQACRYSRDFSTSSPWSEYSFASLLYSF